MAALLFELLTHLVRDRSVDNDRLFGRADRAVIETCTRQNIRNRLFDVGRTLNKYRHIARPDAKRRLALRNTRHAPAPCRRLRV